MFRNGFWSGLDSISDYVWIGFWIGLDWGLGYVWGPILDGFGLDLGLGLDRILGWGLERVYN